MLLKPIAYLETPYSDPDPAIRKFRERAATQMAFDLLKQNVADELGNVFLSLLLLSDKIGVVLIGICLQKVEKIKEKYPISLSKGKAIKYTELQNS
ncbi:MAG TPA: hypothetical protein VNK03_03905 [Gammaproteobacteria bacterium]|nr:hypothetical protein [Gammaproteobacteria bacterium]